MGSSIAPPASPPMNAPANDSGFGNPSMPGPSAGRAAPPTTPTPDPGVGTAGASSGASGAGGSVPNAPPPGEPASCVVASEQVSGRALHFVVDESLAMVFPRDLWTPLGTALDSFVSSQHAASLSVGVQFFQGECDAGEHAVPDVPIAKVAELPLPTATMDGRTHGIGAATTRALTGGLEAAHEFGDANATRGAVVLISGSEPNACGDTADTAAEAAGAALALERPLPTYVLALRDLPSLDRVAQAGGTDGAVRLDGAVSAESIAGAVDGIATSASCEFVLSEAARPYAPDRINVKVRDGGAPASLPGVADAASCDPESGGFYLDDPENPGKIVLCPTSCDRVLRGGTADLEYGCATETL